MVTFVLYKWHIVELVGKVFESIVVGKRRCIAHFPSTPTMESSAVPMEDVTTRGAEASGSDKPRKRFEVKKWNAVALWAWGNET